MSGIGPGGASTSTAPPRAGGDDKIATATAKHKATRRHKKNHKISLPVQCALAGGFERRWAGSTDIFKVLSNLTELN
jgi:hypothetical protein